MEKSKCIIFIIGILISLAYAIEENQSVADFVAGVISDSQEKDRTQGRDVAVINVNVNPNDNSHKDTLNTIVAEISKSTTILFPNQKVRDQRSGTASFTVIVSDVNNYTYLVNQFYATHVSSWYKNTAKFVFVATRPQYDMLNHLIDFFNFYGILNYVILYRDSSWKAYTFNTLSLEGKTNVMSLMGSDSDYIFPDKLKDLHGYTYRLAIVNQNPRITYNQSKLNGIDAIVLQEIAKNQNAKVNVAHVLEVENPNLAIDYINILNNRDADFSLNTALRAGLIDSVEFINTYDQNGFCAMCPIPQRLTFLHYLLTPFDSFSWTLLVISTVLCGLLWKLLTKNAERSNTSWYFMFGVVANFLGQSIPFRNNRKMQVILLQLCILMTFIMGNAYQSLIISSMSLSRDGIRFKTFNELFKSEMKMKVDSLVYRTFLSSGEYQSVIDRMEPGKGDLDYKELSTRNMAIIARCDLLKHAMDFSDSCDAAKYYYMLPETIMYSYEQFPVSARNPFAEKLQTYNDLIFESGIRQYWSNQIQQKTLGKDNRDRQYTENEEYLLSMKDVHGTFYVLFVGCAISIFVLLFEIFWHDCLRHINYKKHFSRLTRKVKKPKMRVRRIQVQPWVQPIDVSNSHVV